MKVYKNIDNSSSSEESSDGEQKNVDGEKHTSKKEQLKLAENPSNHQSKENERNVVETSHGEKKMRMFKVQMTVTLKMDLAL